MLSAPESPPPPSELLLRQVPQEEFPCRSIAAMDANPVAGLGLAGAALRAELVTAFEFGPRERPVLALACAQADDVRRLELLIEADGIVTLGAKGQVRLSAALAEVRASRLALARLITLLELPEIDADDIPRTARSLQAQRAAQARWARNPRNHNDAAS